MIKKYSIEKSARRAMLLDRKQAYMGDDWVKTFSPTCLLTTKWFVIFCLFLREVCGMAPSSPSIQHGKYLLFVFICLFKQTLVLLKANLNKICNTGNFIKGVGEGSIEGKPYCPLLTSFISCHTNMFFYNEALEMFFMQELKMQYQH